MKKELTDDNIDEILRNGLAFTGPTDADLDEITGDPRLLREIKRGIENERSRSRFPWPPPLKLWLPLTGAAALGAFVIAIFLAAQPVSPRQNEADLALAPIASQAAPTVGTFVQTVPADKPVAVTARPSEPSRSLIATHVTSIRRPLKFSTAPTRNPSVTVKKEEIRTDYIALSYARSPASGQIVRVKVPSSMKVSLGVADRVKDSSELVDAEILVGDDGLTRAIRFIR